MEMKLFCIATLLAVLALPCLADSVGNIRMKAENGDAVEQYNLGYMYENGEDVPVDYKKAAYWYGKAAGQGDEDAKHNLSAMYAKGKLVANNHAETAVQHSATTRQGNPDANANAAMAVGAIIGLGMLATYDDDDCDC